MHDEPRRHRRYLILLGLTALATAPWPFAGRELMLWWGLPVWLWWSFGMTAALAALTSWGVSRFWRADESDGDRER